jgi:hypothetical protein
MTHIAAIIEARLTNALGSVGKLWARVREAVNLAADSP